MKAVRVKSFANSSAKRIHFKSDMTYCLFSFFRQEYTIMVREADTTFPKTEYKHKYFHLNTG